MSVKQRKKIKNIISVVQHKSKEHTQIFKINRYNKSKHHEENEL